MTNRIAEASPLIYARVAGILYLVLFPLSIFGILYVPSTMARLILSKIPTAAQGGHQNER